MKTKDVGLRIRVDRDLRTAFIEACRQEDRPAAQVIREFMRGYVDGRSGMAITVTQHPPKKKEGAPS